MESDNQYCSPYCASYENAMQPHYVDCEESSPRWAEVADKEKAARVREVMLNTQEFNEQLGQHHLVDGAALHDGLGDQVTGQLHLTKHAYCG